MRKSLILGGLGFGFAVGACARAGADAPPAAASAEADKPAFTFKAEKGFLDDPFAVEAESGILAVLRTDSASFARIELVDLGAHKTKQVIALGDPHPVFERILFAGRDRGLVVIVRDSTDGRRTAQYFAPDGKPLGLVGPVTDFGVAWRGGKPLLIGWQRDKNAADETTFSVSQYMLDGLARVGKPHGYVATKAGELKKPLLKIVAWQDGYSQILGQRPGAYDAKKDFRQPDQAATLDALAGTFVSTAEIGDVYGWALVGELKRKRPNRSLFAVMAEDGSSLDFVDGQGRRTPIKLPVALQMYEPRSLQEQEDATSGVLYFSLAVDPLNPEALNRRKADKPFLDVYAVRVPAGPGRVGALTGTRLVRAFLDDQPVSWVASARHLVLLRKFKSFSRGGGEMEVYALK